MTLQEIVAQAEKRAIKSALRRKLKNGNGRFDIEAVCGELGIHRTTLWKKMRAYGLRKRILVDVKGA